MSLKISLKAMDGARGEEGARWARAATLTTSPAEPDSAPIQVDLDVAMQSRTIANMLPDDEEDMDEDQECVLSVQRGAASPLTQRRIPIGDISRDVLARCIEWMEYHHEHPWPELDATDLTPQQVELKGLELATLDDHDKAFFGVADLNADASNLNNEYLFNLILGANVLAAKDMLDTGCKCVAFVMKNRSPEELRVLFNIPSDFTAEEERQIRRENEWAEERQ